MKTILLQRLLLSAACALPLFTSGTAHAGILEDDEARKAILDLRAKVDTMRRELAAQIDTKSDKTSTVDLLNQNEQLRGEIARLRGQIEVMSNELANAQKRQKDFYVDLDARLRKLEPQKVTLDGKEATVDPSEQKAFDNAQQIFKAGEYKQAASALGDFLRRYSDSAFAPQAQFLLGSAYYAARDCKSAIASYRELVKQYPDSPKAADAMLSIASCHTELKEKPQAKKALQALIAQYPDSDAARTAKERLAAWK